MNQILVTKKLYITPELKRKKKIYKFDFFLSIFLVCILISACIYAEYDRNKSEEVSKEILSDLDIKVDDTTVAKSNVLVVVLNDENVDKNNVDKDDFIEEKLKYTSAEKKTTSEGYNYYTIGTIKIPKINLNYPILEGENNSDEETEALLKISPTKFWGPDINEVGNYCIVGHNYRNKLFFSKVPTLEKGDMIEITDLSGRTINYKIYNKYEVEPDDVTCTTQLTNGQKEITLITCTNDSKHRIIVKGREVK